MDFNIRKASKNDLPEVLNLVKELAIYENAPEEVSIKLKDLEIDCFGDNPLFWIILAENSKGIIGMSFYFIRYSTWKGKCLYLEDLVVKEEYRGKKIGEALFEATIKTAKEINAKQMNWQVLDWNEPAINFYKKFDAELDEEWINGKIRL
jgi:GNAT superfamily N-acetyltransferase